jgi:hypothetical protein
VAGQAINKLAIEIRIKRTALTCFMASLSGTDFTKILAPKAFLSKSLVAS